MITISKSKLENLLNLKINFYQYKNKDLIEFLSEEDLLNFILEIKELSFEQGFEEANYQELQRQDDLR